MSATPIDEAPVTETESLVLAHRRPGEVSLAIEQQREAGLNALARMTDDEFEGRKRALVLGLARFKDLMNTILEPGVDLMMIPGVEKPVFTLSAAEKTSFVAGLVPSFRIERALGAPPETPAIHYTVHCSLHLGNTDGPTVATGIGSCSSHERKYRYRYAEKTCPACGHSGALLRSKHRDDRGPFAGTKPFFCWSKKGGCNAKFPESDERITKQAAGLVENADVHDLDNTLLKMGKKRAYVDANKTATCASGIVTQDVEEGHSATSEASDLRDQIYVRAKGNGIGTFGGVLDAARTTLGRASIRTKADFDKLSAAELTKILASFAPTQEEIENADNMPIELAGDNAGLPDPPDEGGSYS